MRDRAYHDLLATIKPFIERIAELGTPLASTRAELSRVLQDFERNATARAAATTGVQGTRRTGAAAASLVELEGELETAEPAAPSQRSQLQPPELRGAGSKRKKGGGENWKKQRTGTCTDMATGGAAASGSQPPPPAARTCNTCKSAGHIASNKTCPQYDVYAQQLQARREAVAAAALAGPGGSTSGAEGAQAGAPATHPEL